MERGILGGGVRLGDGGGRISVEKGEIDTNHTVQRDATRRGYVTCYYWSQAWCGRHMDDLYISATSLYI